MAKLVRVTLLLLLWTTTGHSATSSSPSFIVDTWDTDEGLPQNSVITMVQTQDGYLWLGTLGGLVRFDGVNFKVYDESNTPGLRSSRIVKLFEDSRKQLWVGTETAGISMVRDGRVINLDVGRGTREGRLMSVAEDSSGAVWLLTLDGQLARYRDGSMDVWNISSPAPSGCQALAWDDSGLLWLGAAKFLTGLAPLKGAAAQALPVEYQSPVGQLGFLLGSKHRGYWLLADGAVEKRNRDGLERRLADYPWNPGTPIVTACEDQQGNLVVATHGEGVFWFDNEGRYTRLSRYTSGLASDFVLSLCFDREGDLWVGTDGGGLNRVKRPIFHVLEESRNFTVQTTSQDSNGGLWVGYNGQRIERLLDGKLQSFTNRDERQRLFIRSVLVDRDQEVWVGTFLGGLFKAVGGQLVPVPGADRLPQNISALYQDRAGHIWAGTEGGLGRWDGTNWTLFTTTDGLAGKAVRAIAEDKEGSLWAGTEGGGLNRFRAGRWETLTNGLPSRSVSAILADSDGALWVGTGKGLARVKNGVVVSLEGRIEPAHGSIGYLFEDDHGNLWFGSNTGLKRASKSALNRTADDPATNTLVRVYGKADGLPTRECTQGSQPAACRSRDGRLWFPTIKGLAWVEPRDLRGNTNPPPVAIEKIRIDGATPIPEGLRTAPPKELTVPPRKQSVEIDFSSMNLSAPEKGRFRYQLEGHEAPIEVPGNTRSVRYSRLPPATYTFRVSACNEDGVWSPEAATMRLTVQPPFWRTWWFISVMVLSVLGLVAGSVHYVSTQKLQREMAALREQEALEKERSRIARDLHDQLGANLTQMALLSEMAEADKNLPDEVSDHARQISHTALETTRALDEIVWTVNPANDTVDGLINYVCKYAQDYLALANLRYRLEVPPELPSTPISPELRHNVFLVAKEAINNLVKHAGASAAWVRLSLQPDSFALEIEDNGKGIAEGDRHKGRNGLRNMHKRMADVGGTFSASGGTGGGTLVRLTAPLPKFTKSV